MKTWNMTFKCSALVKATEKKRFYKITCVYTKEAGLQLNRIFWRFSHE